MLMTGGDPRHRNGTPMVTNAWRISAVGFAPAVVIHPAIDSSCVKVARFLVYEIPDIAAFRSLSIFMASTPTLVRRQNSQVACRTTVLHMDSVQSFLNRFAFLATIFVLALLIAYMTQ